MSLLEETLARVPSPDQAVRARTGRRLDSLTKPPGSLGRLERLAMDLAGMTGRELPRFPDKVVYTLAGDHGVTEEGVSLYPQAVTAQMVLNFVHGGAAISVLSRLAGARLVVADFGMASDLPPGLPVLDRKVRKGSRNFAREPALTRDEALRALEAGILLAGEGDLIATGEMGIGNSSAAAALTAVMTGRPAAEVAGRGTGLDDQGLKRKIAVLERALVLHRPNPKDPLGVLACLGGLEIAGLTGLILGSAARRVPVLLDGFIAGSAALIAAGLCPRARAFMIASHLSAEPGHAAALQALDLEPLLRLELRLGEGTGAALAMHLVEASCRILSEMATFGEAAVSGPSGP